MKKILSGITIMALISSGIPFSLIYANSTLGEDQTLTAPSPTFVENQVQPVSDFKLNKFLLGYNSELAKNTYIKQNIILDRDNFGGLTFRMSRINELKPGEEPEKLKLSLIQKNNAGIDQVLTSTIMEGVNSMSKTEVKWLFPTGITIVPNRELSLKIEVSNPKIIGTTFSYYVYGQENYISKPIYFGNMVFFDGNNEVTTSDLMNLTILRSDTNNLGVPIESEYKYPKLDSIPSYLQNASNIKVITSSSLTTTNSNTMCSTLGSDNMTYRVVTGPEFEYLLRHSMYINDLIDKVGPFTSASYVSSAEYYQFSGLTNTQVKNEKRYTGINTTTAIGTKFTFCVYLESANLESDTKKIQTARDENIVMSGLGYDTAFFLTNKTSNQNVINLNANTAIFNNINKGITGTPLDTGVDVQGGNIIKVFGRIAINNSGFHDSNGYYSNGQRQGHIVYKIGNSEWKEGGNIIEVKENGRLYLSVMDNDENLANNLGTYKLIIDKVIVTNSVRNNNNLYFNVNKNINDFKISLGETTNGTDFISKYTSNFTDTTKIKVKGLSYVYENKYADLAGGRAPAFDGSYYYAIKGNKLIRIGSGYNETVSGDITIYTIDKDLSNILSMVAINGELYVGYNDKGLSTYIGKLVFSGSGTVSVVNVNVPDGLLQVDLGDIKNKKLDNNRYLLASDDKYIYNISYLAGNETNGNDITKDKGYQIRVFDPQNSMSMIKDINVSPITDKNGTLLNKIGYYTEGAFVDRNYIYIMETSSTLDDVYVVILDKVTFEFQGKVLIKQLKSACVADSNETTVYSCAKSGVFDLLNNRLITLSGNVGKLHFYNIDLDNLVHFRIPDSIDLDNINQNKKFLIKYNYDYNKLKTPETYISYSNGETISNNTKYVKKGIQLKNNKITATIADVVNNVSDDRLYNEYNGGLVNLTRNDGDSSSIRKNDLGINFSQLSLNGVIHKWRGDYGTVSKIEDKGFIIKGERDNKQIVPSIRYELNENSEFMKVSLILRNDSSVGIDNNNIEYITNILGTYDFRDENGYGKNGIGENAKKYIVADDQQSDDSLVFAIKNTDTYSANQRLGMDSGPQNNVKLMVKNFSLNAYEERTFDFYIGSKSDAEDSDSYYNKILASKDLITLYSNSNDYDDVNKKLLSTNVTKSDRIITSPVIGTDPGYTYESNAINIISAFNETFDADRVDASGVPLSKNGWWSDNFKRNATTNELETTIQNAVGNGMISTLELVKYVPDDTQISFKAYGTTDGAIDSLAFFMDDTQILKLNTAFNGTYNYAVPKGLHIFTWKYRKDQFTGSQNDIVKLDNITIGKVLDVFGDNCPYSGSALFYTNSYFNNFSKIETSNGQNYTYRTSLCSDELMPGFDRTSGNTGRAGPVNCNEENVGVGTQNGVTSRTTLGDTNGGWAGGGRTRAYGWYISKYGNGQTAAANMFVDAGANTDNLYFDIMHPQGKGDMKIYFDGIFGPQSSDDYLNLYWGGSALGSGGYNVNSGYMNQQWQTKILNKTFTGNESVTLNASYGETDGGDDGATFLDNVIAKIKDPKSGCHMPPKAYNDKLGTHFLIPGYNMQTSSDRTKDVKGVAHVIPMEADTFVEIQKINPTNGTAIGDKIFLYNERVGQKLSFNVEQGFNYEVVTNKNVSLLMDNFYPDLTRTGDTTADNTPTYDVQNGDKFVVMVPGNQYKKGNVYMANYGSADATVSIRDLTNNKTNMDFVIKAETPPLTDEQIAALPIDKTIAGTHTIASGGGQNSYFISNDGTVYAVGVNNFGQLGNGSYTSSLIPVVVNTSAWGTKKIISVTAGSGFALFLTEDGIVYGVGTNNSGSNGGGQLGTGNNTDSAIPVPMIKSWGTEKIVSISSSNLDSYILTDMGNVYFVGNNYDGVSGNGTTQRYMTPIQVVGPWGTKKIKQVSMGNGHGYFLTEDGIVYSVGTNSSGSLGNGTLLSSYIPILVNTSAWGTKKIIKIDKGLFLSEDGIVYGVGSNGSGELGDGTTISKSIPVAVNTSAWGTKKIVDIVTSDYGTSYFLADDGSVYSTGYDGHGALGNDAALSNKNIPVAVNTSAWGTKKIVSISTGNGSGLFLAEDGTVYGVGYNGSGKLGDGTITERAIPVAVNTSAWSPKTIGMSVKGVGFPRADTGLDETNKPYKSIKGIGEGQILKITSTQPVTLYYGLGTTPAISELISPNSQDFYYPVLADPANVTDYNTQMYTYYDLNLAKIQNYLGYTVRSGTINIGDNVNSGITENKYIGTWNKGISTGPVGLAVGNKSSSYNYSYPIKSSKKLYGIGNQYLFNNVNANKLIIIADTNGGNSVNFSIKAGNGTATNYTLLPKQTLEYTITNDTFYTIETTDVNKHLYLFAQRGDNVRNTFATGFKSREDKQLPNKIIKNNIGDKYLKYDIMGDFDFITDEPKTTGIVNINNTMWNTANSNIPAGSITNVPVSKNDTLVVNGIWSNSDATPNDLIVDTMANGKYINGQKYKTQTASNLDGGLFYKSTIDPTLRYTGGGFKNTGNDDIFQLATKDIDSTDNGPDAIYKVYDKSTYFPQISWEPLYDYVKPTGLTLPISLDGTAYFGKRNLSQKTFDLAFNNGVMNITTGANTTEFTDTYFIPIIRQLNATTLDYVELNKASTLKFTRTGSDYGVLCATIEDNNRSIKNICYTNSITQGVLKTDLLNIGRIKSLDSAITNHVRTLYSDYTEIFPDGTKPMKLLGLEFTGVKKTNASTTFSNISVNNFTDVNPDILFKPNTNIYSEDTPLSHSLKVGILDIKRGVTLLNPQTATLDIQSSMNTEYIAKRKTYTANGLDYHNVSITDNDVNNTDMNESTYNGNTLFQLEEKQDYILFFRAKGFGVKQIELLNQDDTYNYINSVFTPRQYTGNMIESGAYDTGDFYSLKFKTGWGANDKVKVKLINHSGDLQVSDIRILKVDDSDFANSEMVKQGDGTFVSEMLPNTGKLPTYLSKDKKGTTIGDVTYKLVSFYKENALDWIGTLTDTTSLESKIARLKTSTDNTLLKVYSYSNDKNILNFVDGNKYDNKSVDIITTNIDSDVTNKMYVRFGLVGTIKLNGTYIFKNLPTDKLGCIPGSGSYTDYATDNIKEKNCLVEMNFIPGNNQLEIVSVNNNNAFDIKGVYKDKSFSFPSIGQGITNYELLTYDATPGMPVGTNSFIPNNTTLSNAITLEGQSANIGILGQNVEVMSEQNLDRDYSLKDTPVILNTDTDRNADIKDITRLVEFGIPRKVAMTSGTNESDYIKSNVMDPNGVVNINFSKTSSIGLNTNDVLETYVNFTHKPKQFNIQLKNTSSVNSQNIFWGENFMFATEVDGKNIINAGNIDDIQENKWYKIYIPIKGTIFEGQTLDQINFSAFAGDFKISELTILKDKLTSVGNNIKITFDVDILPDTQKRDIIFGLTNNATLLSNQGYEVRFSKNGATTEILKNGVVIGTQTNEKSFIKDGVSKYTLMFVKNKDKLFLSAKYDYLDPSDGILKVVVDNILEATDTAPLNLKNSQLVFKNNKNKYKVSNIKVEDGEDLEKLSFVKISSINQQYSSGKITLYNNKGQSASTNFQLYDNLEDMYVSLKGLLSYNSMLTDIVIQPNELNGVYDTFRTKEVDFIKESETPAIISGNSTMDILGTTIVKKGSDVLQTFKNTKEYIMGFTVFVSKVITGTQSEGLTLRMYESDVDGNPKEDGSGNKVILAQKTVNTDAVRDYPNITPLKIVFPQIAVIKDKNYVFELSTNNEKGLYVYGTNTNTFLDGYAYNNKNEKSYAEAFEFNELGNRIFGEKGSIGYLGSTLNGPDSPTRVVDNGENLKIVGHKSNNSTVTIIDSSNIDLRYQASFIFKGKFPKSNGTGSPIIAEKQIDNNVNKRVFGFYVDKDTNKLHYSFRAIDGTRIADGISNFDISDQDMTLGVTVDTSTLELKIYKDGVLSETLALPESVRNTPFINLDSDNSLKFMGGHAAWGSSETMDLDYFRIYDRILGINEIQRESNSINKFKYRLPYDIAFHMISKTSDIETIEERTYDLSTGVIYDVSGDLILEGYDSGDGVKRLILKGNSTFRVRGNIYINADEVLVINDNTKDKEDDAISYIGFVCDNDIIIGKDVKFMQGGYYANGSIKAELSNKQLKVNGLLAGNEVDLQSRTYLQMGKICSADQKDNCSVILEFDKRIYKKMPPLFYENNNKSGIKIEEE